MDTTVLLLNTMMIIVNTTILVMLSVKIIDAVKRHDKY